MQTAFDASTYMQVKYLKGNWKQINIRYRQNSTIFAPWKNTVFFEKNSDLNVAFYSSQLVVFVKVDTVLFLLIIYLLNVWQNGCGLKTRRSIKNNFKA